MHHNPEGTRQCGYPGGTRFAAGTRVHHRRCHARSSWSRPRTCPWVLPERPGAPPPPRAPPASAQPAPRQRAPLAAPPPPLGRPPPEPPSPCATCTAACRQT
eukprot:7388632-Prymnesium_polylepis.2